MKNSLSIILPAKDEGCSLTTLLPRLQEICPEAEIIVVDDGSHDDTVQICQQLAVRVVSHPYAMGNGAAVKTGARHATGDILIFMDADGQHDPADIPRLLDHFSRQYDMVVGARGWESQASWGRGIANFFYNRFASWMTGHPIADLTSGFRVVRAEKFLEFLYLLPNHFSYPTTITMAFFRSGYSVAYLPIQAAQRIGKSHLRPLQDGLRFLLIIFKIGILYSPLKIFLPISLHFFLLGLTYYLYTYWHSGHFTNMAALLLSVSVIIFLIGLISEQISVLFYKRN